MPDTVPTLELLARVRRRLHRRRLLQAGVDAGVLLLAATATATAWNRVAVADQRLGARTFVFLVGAAGLWLLLRARERAGLAGAARRVDEAARLHDEMLSALWFRTGARPTDPWVREHLGRADATARSLDARRLVPWRAPRRLRWLGLAAGAWGLVGLLPGAAGGVRAEGLAGGPATTDPNRVGAEVVELADRAEAQPRPDHVGGREPPRARLQEQGQERAAAEPAESAGDAEPGERAGEQARQRAAEGAEQADAREADEARQTGTQQPQDAGAEGEQQALAEPGATARQEPGEGAEEAAAMLSGGDEVFLQEGGEDIQRARSAQEDVGHATREGGGEETREGGEPTSLQVQLERELLAIPEPQGHEQEDPEEQVTRAERSFLRFERLRVRSEFDVGEPLQPQPVPWRARRLVLEYFRTLRARDNEKPKGQQ